MENSKDYKDYSKYATIMVSTDRLILNEKSAVRKRMLEYANLYKELHIIVFSTTRMEPISLTHNCTVYSTNSLVRWNYVHNARTLGKRIIKKFDKQDPILITCQDPFETGLVGKCIASLKNNSELLLQIHTDLYSPYFTSNCIGIKNALINKIRIFISEFTLPHAQVIRVVSKKIADSLIKKGIDAEKIIIKPIPVDVGYIRDAIPSFDLHKKYPEFDKIILMVCRVEAEKNIAMAVEALKIVKETLPKVGMVIVGSGGKTSSLKKLAYNFKIDSSLIFAGWQTDTTPYYKGCDVVLVTSYYEGYGMVFEEARAAGCKIVSTDVGIARDVGAHIADWNPKDIAQKLIEVLR